MAILLRGLTTCALCGNLIQQVDEAVLFPPIILNESDPLYGLSDGSCHAACVSTSTLAQAMLVAVEESSKRRGPGKRACEVCGDQILDYDDYFGIGYLGDASRSELGKFNYTHLHKSHMKDWKQAGAFLTLARTAVGSGWWQGCVLPNLIREIEVSTLAAATEDQGDHRR